MELDSTVVKERKRKEKRKKDKDEIIRGNACCLFVCISICKGRNRIALETISFLKSAQLRAHKSNGARNSYMSETASEHSQSRSEMALITMSMAFMMLEWGRLSLNSVNVSSRAFIAALHSGKERKGKRNKSGGKSGISTGEGKKRRKERRKRELREGKKKERVERTRVERKRERERVVGAHIRPRTRVFTCAYAAIQVARQTRPLPAPTCAESSQRLGISAESQCGTPFPPFFVLSWREICIWFCK